MYCLILSLIPDASIIGWSTSIPNYNPVDIVANIRRQMEGEPMVPMTPWYRGFKGKIEKVDNKGKYLCSGTARVVDSKTVEIIELPIKKWTDDYKKQLEDWIVGSEKDKTDKEKTKVVETFVKVRFYSDYSFQLFIDCCNRTTASITQPPPYTSWSQWQKRMSLARRKRVLKSSSSSRQPLIHPI